MSEMWPFTVASFAAGLFVSFLLVRLVEERAELSVAVQQTRESGDHGHDVGRERELIEKASRGSEDSVLTPEEREMVFGSILRVSRSAQRRSAAANAAASGGGEDEAPVASANGTSS